ncbi:MAG: hypothetical protein V7713_06640 [Marinobacter sp.]|nr:hypothetical protein [Marinobacter sp. AC-23]
MLNTTSMFNHGNVRLPLWLDKRLRLVVVMATTTGFVYGNWW